MTSDDIEALLRAIGDDNGTNIEEIDCTPDQHGGWNIGIKADGNPFSSEDFGENEEEELLVPLRGRDCKYHSARLGSADSSKWGLGKGIPTGWRAEWCSAVEGYDEYTDSPDTHRITAWLGPSGLSEAPRRAIRTEFEEHLASEASGDLFLAFRQLDHIRQPIAPHQKEALKNHVSAIMRKIACL